jgi:hypothetical protein
VLFIVWDEDDHTANNRVLALVVSPRQGHPVSDQPYTAPHYLYLCERGRL